jgi:hypothetical protein
VKDHPEGERRLSGVNCVLHPSRREQASSPLVEFEVFGPKTEKEAPAGTVARAKVQCLVYGALLSPERVRLQLASQRGGADVIFDPSPPPSPSRRGSKGKGGVGDWMERLEEKASAARILSLPASARLPRSSAAYSRLETADGREVQLAE